MIDSRLNAQAAHAKKTPLRPKTLAEQVEDDTDFVAAIRHVLKPNEKPVEWLARIGLSPVQVAGMNRDAITEFVRFREESLKDDLAMPGASFWNGNKIPARFMISEE